MPVLELETTVLERAISVCANDGCSRRFNLGWDGICDESNLLAQDHEAGMHTQPMLECPDCW